MSGSEVLAATVAAVDLNEVGGPGLLGRTFNHSKVDKNER